MTSPVLNVELMHEAAGQATALLRVLANEDRLLLLCQLTQGEACVSELEELLGIRQPTLSQQLGVLRNEEMVSTRREGKKIFYQVCDARAIAMLGTLYGLYCPLPPQAPSSTPSTS
ncbi:MAG: metalloregulator ArsR/SmtB family transcription factor [Polaromonas sp.]|nr:metalloregulator ArsR/SmtB family transcription factor [Polaromonas sp.]